MDFNPLQLISAATGSETIFAISIQCFKNERQCREVIDIKYLGMYECNYHPN